MGVDTTIESVNTPVQRTDLLTSSDARDRQSDAGCNDAI